MASFTPPPSASPEPSFSSHRNNTLSQFLKKGDLKYLLTNNITLQSPNLATIEIVPTSTSENIVIQDVDHHIIRDFSSISWQIPSSPFSKKDALAEIGQFALLDTNMLIGFTFSSTARVYKNLVWDKSNEKNDADFPFKKIALVASLLFSAKILKIANFFKNDHTQEVDKKTATNSHSERSVLLLNQENKAGLTDVLPMTLRNINSYTGTKIFPYEENMVTISGQNSTKVIISIIADTLFGHSKQKQATEDFLNSMIKANPETLNATIKHYAETYKIAKVTKSGNDTKVEECSLISQTDDNKIQINPKEFVKVFVALIGTSYAFSNNEQPTDYCYLALRDISINETDAFCKQQNAESIKNYDLFSKIINILQNQTQIMNRSEIAFLNPENETLISSSTQNEILNTLKTLTISKNETSVEVVEFKNITIVQKPFFAHVLKSMNFLNIKEYAYQNYGTELNLLKENGSYTKTVTTVLRTWWANDEQNLTVTVGERELAETIITNYTEYLPKAIAERIKLIESWKPVKSITAKKKERSWFASWLHFFALTSDDTNDTDNPQHFSILIADEPLKKALEEVIVIYNKNPELHEFKKFNDYVQKYIQDKIKKGELQERKEYTSKFRTFYTGNLFSFLSVRATIERLEQNKLQQETQRTRVGSIVEDIYNNTSIDTLVVILQVHEESPLNENLKNTETLYLSFTTLSNAIVGNWANFFGGLSGLAAKTFGKNEEDTATIYSTTNGSYFPSGKSINLKESAPQNNNFTNSTDENHTGEENKSDYIKFVQTYGSQISVLGTAIYQVYSKNAFNDVLPSLEIIPVNTLYVEKSGYKFKHVVQMIGFVLSLFSKWFLFPSLASQTLTDSAAWINIIDTLNLINGGLIPNLCMHVVNNIALMNSLSLIEKSFELLNPSYVLRRPIKSGSNRKIRNVLDVFFVVWNRRKDLRTLFKPKPKYANSKMTFRYLICNLQNMSFVESHQMLIEKDCYYYVDKTLGVVICGLSFFLQQEDGFNPTGMFYTTINLIPFVFNKVCADNQQKLFELKPYEPIICKEKKICNEEQMGSFEFWKEKFITPAVFDYIKEDGEYTTLPPKDKFNSASQFVLREFGLINDFIEPVFYWKKTTTKTSTYKLVAYISDEECICYLQNYQSYDNWYSCKNNVVKKIENLNYEEKLDLRGKNVTQLLYEKVDDNKRQPIDVKNGIKLKEIWREKIDKIRNAIKMQVKAEYPTQALNDLKEWEYQTHSNRIHFDCPVKCVLSCQFPEWEKTEIDKMTAKVYADFKRNDFFKNDDDCIDKLQAIDFANQGIELDPHPDQYENACLTTSQLKKIIKELSMTIDTKHEWKKIEYYVWTGDNLVRSDNYSPEEDKLKQLTDFCIVVLPSGFFNGENIVHFLPFKLDNNFSNQLTKN